MHPVLDHIATVVRPALRNYLTAEKSLTDALASKDANAIATARQDVMLAARQAVDVLHHLSDFVLKEPSPTLTFANIEDVRSEVEAKCVFGQTNTPVADVGLLRDVADAFKHHRPDRPSATVLVSTGVVAVGSGYGQMRVGEGKYGGGEQVVVTTKDGGKRALSSVLQNVFDAWMTRAAAPADQPILNVRPWFDALRTHAGVHVRYRGLISSASIMHRRSSNAFTFPSAGAMTFSASVASNGSSPSYR
jgi:hypothetical protein